MHLRERILLVALLCLPTTAQAVGIHWQVVESDERHLLLELTVDGGELRDVPGTPYQRIELGSLPQLALEGLPLLPMDVEWAVAPPRGDVRLRVLESESEVLGRARLLPRAFGVLREGIRGGDPVLGEELREAESYADFRAPASESIELGDVIWMARQRLAPIRVRPVSYDARGETVEILRRARIELRFEAGSSGGVEPGRSDPRVARTLNAEMADRWRGLPERARQKIERWDSVSFTSPKRATGVIPFDPMSLESDEIRIRVPATRLWQLPLGALLQLHGLPTDLPRSHVRLYQKRPDPDGASVLTADVPIHFYGDPDPAQPVASNDLILFFGHGPRDDLDSRQVDGATFPAAMAERVDNYNSDNIYFLAYVDPGTGSWKRMRQEALAASTGSPQPSFAVVDRFEEDLGYQDNPANISQPRYHWNDSRVTRVEAQIALRSPVPASTMDVTAHLTRTPVSGGASRNVDFELLDGQTTVPLGTVDVSPALYDVLFPETWSNVSTSGLDLTSLRIGMERPNPTSFLSTYLGHVEVAYQAQYIARSNRFLFDSGQAGVDVDLEVTGFTRDDLMLVDATDPHDPIWIQLAPENVVQDGGAGSYKLSIRAPQAAASKRAFRALPLRTAPEILINNDTELDTEADVLTATGAAQVLAIGPAEFRTASEEWLDWKRQNDTAGWVYSYVDVQQIYDHYSGGLKAPGAIKAFLEYYLLMHDARAVLLVGDGNENARELGAQVARDIIPPSVHVQTTFQFDELLASDKWFATFDLADEGILDNYPRFLNKGPDLLIGRLTVNSASELRDQVAKIKRYEQPTANQAWRSKTLWIADDAYSTELIGAGTGCYSERSGELGFRTSQQQSVNSVLGALDQRISAELWDISDVTDDLRAGNALPDDCFDLGGTRADGTIAFNTLTPARLSEGWLVVSYQGHANYDVLAHENFLLFRWIDSLSNQGRPFIFYGMGCHVTDFLRAREAVEGRTIGERLLARASGGAIATYGSSGFEYLNPNAEFMQVIADAFFANARTTSAVLDSDEFTTPWILAEVMAQAELDMLGLRPFTSYREMVAQYNLLGDPLLRVDALPPRVAAQVGGADLDDGEQLLPAPGDRDVMVTLDLTDETGVGQIEIYDVEFDADLDDGIQADEILRTHTSAISLDPVDTDIRIRAAQLQLPVVAQEYKVVIEVYDGAYPAARPSRIAWDVPMPLTLFVDDEEVETLVNVIPSGESADLRIVFTSPISLAQNEVNLSAEGGTLSAVSATSADDLSWIVTASLDAESDSQLLTLDLAGTETQIGAAPKGGGGGDFALRTHYPFPNPSKGRTRFIGQASAEVDEVQLQVYDLSGRTIYDSREAVSPAEEFVLEWDGRDAMGDELANGVYLYRLTAHGSAGTAKSDIGRLVFMR